MTSSGIAVVIPCYELGRTLEEAVESARHQTLPPEDVIVVDDGSRVPFTRNAIARLGEQGVKVIRTEHRGPAHARNVGVDSTATPLVVLLDADDLFEPTYLERAAGLLAESPDVSFVCCALQAFGRASYRWKPPPYDIAESIGRGACGHISTVFRREVWDAVGGFDAAFPRGEDIDFWLRALELGFRGAILDEALVRYRVRRASRYHSAVVQGHYLRAKEMLLDKHRATVASRGEDVFVSLLDFQREQSAHARVLAGEQREVGEEIALVEREIVAAGEAARDLAGIPFDWGELDARVADVESTGTNAIETYYLERFLANVEASGRVKRTLTIRAGDPWPDGKKPAFDRIVVAGALEPEDDPRNVLLQCRRALRPGGVLLAAGASMTLGREKGFGFTEASLRALLSDLFPPATVEVVTYGNLLTCLAGVAGLPPAALNEAELRRVDPWHPTLVVASARLPGARRRWRQAHTERVPRARRGAFADRGAVLAYHRIASLKPDTHGLCTPPEVFKTQLTLVAERCNPLPLHDLVSRAAQGRLPSNAVAVTFDDGYLDNLEVASPILSRLGIPATFFVSGQGLDEEREGLWDTVERILAGDEPLPDRLRIEVDGAELDLPTRSTEERGAALLALHGRLLAQDAPQREALIAALVEWSGRDLAVRSTHRLLTSEELIELAERPGHEIGAHGMHHLLLTAHPEEVRTKELEENRALLEGLVGRPVRSLAYPYGACDFRTTQIAEELGFTVACSVDSDPVTLDSDPLRLPRFEVGADVDGFEFRLERWLAGP